MKYLIRSIKSTLYFVVVFLLITGVMFLISSQKAKGLAYGDMFEEGSLYKLIIFFVLFGAVYPAVSFFKRKIYINKDYTEYHQLVSDTLDQLEYEYEKEDDRCICFRKKGFAGKATRFFEDRITLYPEQGLITIEGYRRDVMRIVSLLSHRIRQSESSLDQ